ncbi:MAG: TonB-dependent receptor [Bacteroidales bacterium]|nr:TonB-dependent receptor [Bacteroidales bacterium]
MKRFFTLTVGLLLLIFCHAQEKTDAMLFGDVKSVTTKEHIPFVSIIVKGTTMGTTADGSGHYKLANLPVGKCVIVARALGYKTLEREVVMEQGKAVQLFFELEDDMLNLEQVVVTGTRTQHYVKDVPVRTEVITAKSLESKNACNLYQALEGTPGIRVENQCQYCNFTMVRMQGLGGEHTQVLIDGQPMYSGLAGVYGLQQLSTLDIGRIEVVKGAGSALYGSSAVAGAINIVTKEPSMAPSTLVDVQMGNYKSNRYNISSSLRNERGNVGLNVYAQRMSDGAIDETGTGLSRSEVLKKDGVSDRVETNLTNAGFSLFIDNPFSSNEKLRIRGKSVFEKRQGGTITDDYYKNPLTDGTEGITTDRYEADLNYTKSFAGNSELNFMFGYVNHSREATNDSFLGDYMATHQDSAPDVRNMRPYLADEYSLTSTLSLSKKIGGHNVLVGVQGFYDNLKESGMYVVVDPASSFVGEAYRSNAKKSAREFGAFLQDEWSIGEKLMVVPGIRCDYHKSGEEYTTDRQVFSASAFPETDFEQTSVSPRLAIKYKLSDKFTFRANAGTGFRAPYGFSEDLHLCSGSPRVWKSSDLDPETSVSYNFSADYYGRAMRVSVNLFRTDLKDKIGFTDADANVSAMGYNYQWKNIDDAFVQGVELSAMASISRHFDFGVDLTYNQGEYKNVREDWVGTSYEKDSKYISRFPAITGNLKLEYSPNTWVFSLIGSYQGEMYIDYYNEEVDPLVGDQSKIKKTDGFMLFNARVAKTIRGVKLYAGVNNILGYVQTEKHLDDAAFMYAPVYGTTFYGGVAIEILH